MFFKQICCGERNCFYMILKIELCIDCERYLGYVFLMFLDVLQDNIWVLLFYFVFYVVVVVVFKYNLDRKY